MMTSSNHDLDHDAERPVTSVLHARVWALLVGFALWFALAVWAFAGAGVTDYLLVIVSGFIFVVVALQLILSRVGRKHIVPEKDGGQPSLREWAARDFDTWQGRLSGAQAALQILLPIAVAAVGMTAFGIVFHLAERGGI
jgi:hypothetical protein